MAIPIVGTAIFWFFVIAASPYGNPRAAMLTLMALVLIALVAIADGRKLWK